jgi:hypothetical protein
VCAALQLVSAEGDEGERSCPFIMRLVNTFQDQLNLYLLLEIAQGGDLYRCVSDVRVMGDG